MTPITIILTTAGDNAGPFDIYSDATGYTCPLVTGVSRASLLAGYIIYNVPDNATSIRIQSTGVCTNYIDIPIAACTPAPTAAPPGPTPNPTTPNPTPNPTPGPTTGPTPNPTPGPTPNPTPNPTPGPTPNPTTPNPTPNPTPAPTSVACYSYTVYAQDGTPNKNSYPYQYVSCDGTPVTDGQVVNDSFKPILCAQEDSVNSSSEFVTWTQGSLCNTPTPTSPPVS
jgi:hypothetical protein